jgi:NAD dependent epimerase/dehydratase family enzyme
MLHRPAVVVAPAFGLRLVLGQFAEDVLGGQRAVPAVLTANGFEFAHQDLGSALRSVL